MIMKPCQTHLHMQIPQSVSCWNCIPVCQSCQTSMSCQSFQSCTCSSGNRHVGHYFPPKDRFQIAAKFGPQLKSRDWKIEGCLFLQISSSVSKEYFDKVLLYCFKGLRKRHDFSHFFSSIVCAWDHVNDHREFVYFEIYATHCCVWQK